MRWIDGITGPMDVSLSKLREILCRRVASEVGPRPLTDRAVGSPRAGHASSPLCRQQSGLLQIPWVDGHLLVFPHAL